MLEVTDFTYDETETILKYYKPLVFLFQDCLIEAKNNFDEEFVELNPDLDKIIGKINEIEFLDEFEIISKYFDEFLEKKQYLLFNKIKDSDETFDYFNNNYLLVEASAIKNLVMYTIIQSWNNKLKEKEIMYTNDVINLMYGYITDISKMLLDESAKKMIFDDDIIQFLFRLQKQTNTIETIISITDNLIDSCIGDNKLNDYNLVLNKLDNTNDHEYTLFQECINKILAMNVYALCIDTLQKSKA